MKNKNIVSKNSVKKLEMYYEALQKRDFKNLNLNSNICLMILNNTEFKKLYNLNECMTEMKILTFKKNSLLLQESNLDGAFVSTNIKIIDSNMLEVLLSEFDISLLAFEYYINLYKQSLKSNKK